MPNYLPIVAALCQSEGYPLPVGEYVFAPPRRWRFDLAWPNELFAIEVQGGLFLGGRHLRAAALRSEYEKLNTANLRGWCVLLILPEQIQNGILQELLALRWPRQPSGWSSRRDWEGIS